MSFFRRKFGERQNKGSVKAKGGATGLSRTPSNCSSRSGPRSPDSLDGEADIGVPHDAFTDGVARHKRPRSLLLSDSVLQEGPELPAESLESPMRTSSRLSKTLLEVVRDKDALSCLRAFLRGQGKEQLIQFWCEAESFHAATHSRRRTHSLQQISKSTLVKRRSGSNVTTTSDAGNVHVDPSQLASSPLSTLTLRNSTEIRNDPPVSDSDHNQSNYQLSAAKSGIVLSAQADANSVSDKSLPHRTAQSFQNSVLKDENAFRNSTPVIAPSDLSSESISTSNTAKSTVPQSSSTNSVNSQTEDPQPNSNLQTLSQESSAQRLGVPGAVSPPGEHSPSSGKPEAAKEDIASKLKKSIERDAVTIFSTYLAKDSPKPIGVDDELRSEAISKICREDGEVDPDCFIQCQKFALDKINNEHFESFQSSEHYCRHQVKVLTTEKIYLPDILLNENALCYYMEYMEQEGGSDLMQMWLAADNFQQQLAASTSGYDWEQAQTDAMVIYDRYFSLQATNPLGFDDKLRFEIEGNICREGGPLPDCFVKAKSIVLKILEKMYFPGYLQSQVYYRYLSDLVNTVQMADDMLNKPFHKGHKRTESDASSDHSVSNLSTGAESVVSRNTLLAVDTRKQRSKAAAAGPSPNIVGDFSMTPDMFNPDELWKRPSIGDLTLGSVNPLGQFVSSFDHDMESGKKKGTGFFKKRKEKEKEEEEMALQIAQMIISDVNTMTKTGETMSKEDS